MLSLVEDRNIANHFQRETLECQTHEWFEHVLSLGAGHVVRIGCGEEDSDSPSCNPLILIG